ncbi:MAG: hypothetical protein ACR2RD_07255 [Woeseiaceae bacterium]
MKTAAAILVVVCLLGGSPAQAQGQDSESYERDLQVVATMIAGGFDNANQSYFDSRGKRDVKHRRLHVDVAKVEAPEIGANVFVASGYWDNDESADAGSQLWVLSADDETKSVRMRAWAFEQSISADDVLAGKKLDDNEYCDLYWRREAAQFRATAESCNLELPREMVLSDKQLWMAYGDEPGDDYQLHRIRNFECYADIPGVGGGRDIPYERYEGFKIHDQGGAVWFESNEGRKLGISLFLVDWPINNYEGIFTRDSFVIYVSEEVDGERKEHGYAFTIPEADRIGINLKWMLASCFMKSNRYATPYM